jgi:hypothetical protein
MSPPPPYDDEKATYRAGEGSDFDNSSGSKSLASHSFRDGLKFPNLHWGIMASQASHSVAASGHRDAATASIGADGSEHGSAFADNAPLLSHVGGVPSMSPRDLEAGHAGRSGVYLPPRSAVSASLPDDGNDGDLPFPSPPHRSFTLTFSFPVSLLFRLLIIAFALAAMPLDNWAYFWHNQRWVYGPGTHDFWILLRALVVWHLPLASLDVIKMIYEYARRQDGDKTVLSFAGVTVRFEGRGSGAHQGTSRSGGRIISFELDKLLRTLLWLGELAFFVACVICGFKVAPLWNSGYPPYHWLFM